MKRRPSVDVFMKEDWKHRQAEQNRNSAIDLLTHSIWHCLYGSESTERTPDQADKDAADILSKIRAQIYQEQS